ncbi:hypothetical protein ABBQ38_014276 [Trebouxia sp. C0009 RCD-2024]
MPSAALSSCAAACRQPASDFSKCKSPVFPAVERRRLDRLLCRAASGGKGHRRRAGKPGLFEVKDVSPPPRVLGIHSLPPDTHNGDQIEVEGQDYVVDSVMFHYKLVGGKYQRDHNQLAVHSTSRFFLNKYLNQMYQKGNSRPQP